MTCFCSGLLCGFKTSWRERLPEESVSSVSCPGARGICALRVSCPWGASHLLGYSPHLGRGEGGTVWGGGGGGG